MSTRGTRLGDGSPTKPRHQLAWGTILGGAPYRALAPARETLDKMGSRWPGDADGTPHASGVKDVEFAGTSDDDLRGFPQVARQRAGYQLHLVQSGHNPSDWQPMVGVGLGCSEIRVRGSREALEDYGVYYVASSLDTVYVLHCFQRESQQSAKSDIDLGKQRYHQMKDLIRGWGTA